MYYHAAKDIVTQYTIDNAPYGLARTMEGQLVVLMRGLPGSGKTKFAAELQYYATVNNLQCVRVSADTQFRSRTGAYFDKNHLKTAHAMCRVRFDQALTSNMDIVIVDNTNIKEVEFKHYMDGARDRKAFVLVVQFRCVNEEEAIDLGQRSVARLGLEDGFLRKKFKAYDQEYFQRFFYARGRDPSRHIIIVDPEEDCDDPNRY